MCFGGSPPSPTKPPSMPTEKDAAVQASLDADRKRRAAQGGFSSTLLTGGLGAPPSGGNRPLKTLLGE